jgi:hypothetical protein
MATLAATIKKTGLVADSRAAETRDRAAVNLEALRPLPNEDVYFFTKGIDNSRLVRQADPTVSRYCWGLIGRLAALGGLLLLLALPRLGGYLAGYRLQALQQEQRELLRVREELELEASKLLTPQKLRELADQMKLLDPEPEQVITLDAGARDTLARKQTE